VARRDQDRDQPSAPPVKGDYGNAVWASTANHGCAGIREASLYSIECRRSRAGERRLAFGLYRGGQRRHSEPPLYLPAARPRGARGVVGVTFTIGASCALASFAITRSSGDKDLDAAARAVVHSAHFPPPPGGSAHITNGSITLSNP
jgi:TonB family protein